MRKWEPQRREDIGRCSPRGKGESLRGEDCISPPPFIDAASLGIAARLVSEPTDDVCLECRLPCDNRCVCWMRRSDRCLACGFFFFFCLSVFFFFFFFFLNALFAKSRDEPHVFFFF